MEKKVEPMECSICGKPIEILSNGYREGNNALPVKDGRCCDSCNATIVIPVRIRRVRAGKAPY